MFVIFKTTSLSNEATRVYRMRKATESESANTEEGNRKTLCVQSPPMVYEPTTMRVLGLLAIWFCATDTHASTTSSWLGKSYTGLQYLG